MATTTAQPKHSKTQTLERTATNSSSELTVAHVEGHYSESVPDIFHETVTFKLVQTPKAARSVATIFTLILTGIVLFLWFVPWQQNITGSGKVTSFVPSVRPQTIDAQITSRIVKWYVNEGIAVKAGDTIAVLQDLNSSFMDRDFVEKVQRVRDRTLVAQEFAIQTAKQRTIQAIQRLLAAEAMLENARVEIQTARIRYKRAEDLTKDGLAAQRDLETATLNLQKSQADSIRAETSLEAAKRDLEAFRNEENRIVQQAEATIAETELRLANSQMRGGASVVLAPSDGIVVRIASVGAGQTVKDGEMLATIVPSAGAFDQAVEIYISSRDAAIVDVGRPVRVQFSGFPAFVFNPGWDNFTFNTFGGKVAVVDAVDDEGSGYYRVLIVPDSTQPQGKWPSIKYLRQGTPSSAWILLDEVSIGFELWRQLNGFPPVLPSPALKGGKEGKDKDGGKEKK